MGIKARLARISQEIPKLHQVGLKSRIMSHNLASNSPQQKTHMSVSQQLKLLVSLNQLYESTSLNHLNQLLESTSLNHQNQYTEGLLPLHLLQLLRTHTLTSILTNQSQQGKFTMKMKTHTLTSILTNQELLKSGPMRRLEHFQGERRYQMLQESRMQHQL